VRQAREEAEFAELSGGGTAVWSAQGDEGTGTVIFDPQPDFQASCLNRVVRVKAVDDLAAIPDLVRPYGPVLQTVGIAAPATRLEALGARSAGWGPPASPHSTACPGRPRSGTTMDTHRSETWSAGATWSRDGGTPFAFTVRGSLRMFTKATRHAAPAQHPQSPRRPTGRAAARRLRALRHVARPLLGAGIHPGSEIRVLRRTAGHIHLALLGGGTASLGGDEAGFVEVRPIRRRPDPTTADGLATGPVAA
jgi:Fe2+ transport system protein FeoA